MCKLHLDQAIKSEDLLGWLVGSKAQKGLKYSRPSSLFFSWDWGPSFPSMGIWRKISIFAIDKPKLHYIKSMARRLSTQNWELQIQAICDLPWPYLQPETLQVTLSGQDGNLLLNETHSVVLESIDKGDEIFQGMPFICVLKKFNFDQKCIEFD